MEEITLKVAIETAIKMEIDAIDFYTDASVKAKNKVGREMFLSIVEDEKRHLKMLRDILKELDIPLTEVNPMMNIRTIFEELRHEMMERVTATDDELNAFKIAMDMEKKGVEFYKKAALSAETQKQRELFERLTREEEQHFAIFANTYFFMQNTGSWFMWEEHSIVDGGTPWA